MHYRSVVCGLITGLLLNSSATGWQDPANANPANANPANATPAAGAPAVAGPTAGADAFPQTGGTPVAPQMPPGFPLDTNTRNYIEELLTYWENTSNQVTHYQCQFVRWHYDPEICNYRKPGNNHLVAAEISRGNIRYRNPDSGMYEVTQKWNFGGPPDEPGGEAKYVRRKLTNADFPEEEKWICDGESIFEYDYQSKRLYELKLPLESRGEGLKNSPLPFMFGATAVELLDRFWIRDVTPANVQGQYWLEAWPKRVSDAQNYSRMEIILTRDPFLPVAVHMYAPNYDEKTKPSRMVFEFEKREINGALAGLLDPFFIRPSTPFGWKRVERDQTAGADPARLGQNPASPVAPGSPR